MMLALSNLCIQKEASTGDSDVNMLIEFCRLMWAHLHVSNLRIPPHKSGGQKIVLNLCDNILTYPVVEG